MSVAGRSCLVGTLACAAFPAARAASPSSAPHGAFTLAQVKSYPFPTELTAAASGSRIAWALDEQGHRNVWVAEGPRFEARRLTSYMTDDGQELTSLTISADGKHVVYVRGGDHGSNWDDSVPVNPTSIPTVSKVQVWTVPFAGGEPKSLGEGDLPVISPRSDVVAFEKDHQIWIAPIDASAPAHALVTTRGESGSVRWSPDASRLAFVSTRGDHA